MELSERILKGEPIVDAAGLECLGGLLHDGYCHVSDISYSAAEHVLRIPFQRECAEQEPIWRFTLVWWELVAWQLEPLCLDIHAVRSYDAAQTRSYGTLVVDVVHDADGRIRIELSDASVISICVDHLNVTVRRLPATGPTKRGPVLLRRRRAVFASR